MPYTIVLINGREYDLTESERDSILGKSGFVFIPRLNLTINTTSISVIEPRGAGKRVDRTKQLMGVTPDGELVEKRFGVWYISKPLNPEQYDHEGRSTLRYDGPALLPTPEEYEAEYKHLAPEAWTHKLIGASSEVDDRLLLDRSNRTTGGGFQRLGDGKTK